VPGYDLDGFEAADDTVIWRYMTLPRFESLLTEGLFFAAASQFEDPFEGAITDAAIAERTRQVRTLIPDDDDEQQSVLRQLSKAFADLRRMTKLSCWHALRHENVAMWERYALPGQVGVAVQSTVGSLKRALRSYRLEPTYGEERIVVGAVRYVDYAREEMADPSMLGIFLHKRIEYSDERELRAVLSLRIAVEFGVPIPDDGVLVPVDNNELVHEVRVSPSSSSADLSRLEAVARQAGVNAVVRSSSLARPPTY
jgi:hypothetical protein